MLIAKLVIRFLLALIVYGVLFFLPAGTVAWWRAWVFLGLMVLVSGAMSVWFLRHNKALLEERLRSPIQRNQPLADKVVLSCYMPLYLAWLVFIPLDVFRLHVTAKPSTLVSSVGLALVLAGFWLVFLTFKENSFAAPVIKHQAERQQVVVDTGVYSVVRHPMYAGMVPMLFGTALWLESYTAAVLTATMIVLLVVRILLEERFLERELEGYEAYKARVRYRLIPYMW